MSDPIRSTADSTSLEELFERRADRVYGYALKRCGDAALAEDLTAGAFEAASRHFARGKGHEVTLAWLTVVVRRRLIDHWRHQASLDRRMVALRTELLVRVGDATGDQSAVTAALDSLSNRQRAALVLRYLDDLSVSEVADELGLGYKATESLLSRARRAFTISYWGNA